MKWAGGVPSVPGMALSVEWMRRKRAAVAGVVAAGCVVAVAAGGGAGWAGEVGPGGEDPALARFYEQGLAWGECATGPDDAEGRELDAAGAECAEVTVPLDYAEPEGRTITVAISRLPATDTAHRVGAMLLNSGGPGGPGLDMPLWVAEFMGEDLAARFDLVGMDPRFVGRSTPLDCGWPVGTMIRSAGADRESFRAEAVFQRELAERCERREGEVLPHVTTRNTARDMDVVRAALGEETISYLGYSYGSYLGQVYTQLFPGRTDRVVLDGVLHPDDYTHRLLRGTEEANEAALREWAAWAAARDDEYGLGATEEEVLATVDRIIEAAAKEPLRVGERFVVDEHVVPVVFFDSLGSAWEDSRATLAASTRVLARAADREPVEPTPELAEQLGFLTTGEESAYGSAQTAILCGDVAQREGLDAYWRDLQQVRERYPFAGPVTANVNACEFWDPPVEAPTRVDNDVPALLVAATGDPRTSYASSRAVREQWPSSRLVTLAGARHHGVYGEYGSRCVDGHVNDYLRTGELPDRDVRCEAGEASTG